VLYLGLLAINIVVLNLAKCDNKYWLVSIPLWILLVGSFIVWRDTSDKQYRLNEKDYEKSAKIKGYDYDKLDKLENLQKSNKTKNQIFLTLIAIQTFVTFVLQVIGHNKTDQHRYRLTKYIFGILTILVLILTFMIGIVPTGGIV